MTGTMKMSLTLAAVLAIAATAWSQESDGNLQEQTQQTLEKARQKADAVAKAVDKSEQRKKFPRAFSNRSTNWPRCLPSPRFTGLRSP